MVKCSPHMVTPIELSMFKRKVVANFATYHYPAGNKYLNTCVSVLLAGMLQFVEFGLNLYIEKIVLATLSNSNVVQLLSEKQLCLSSEFEFKCSVKVEVQRRIQKS